MEFHHQTTEQTAKALKTNLHTGLSTAEAHSRLITYGKNRIESQKKHSVVTIFFSQFADFMILILLAAAVVSFFTALIGDGDYTEPIMIILIVVINAVVGTFQEYRAEQAIEALKKLSAPHATVIRSGKTLTVPSEDLVPGDILRVSCGDMVCADARLLESASLKAEEAALTGESVPVDKFESTLSSDTPLAERTNLLYSSTFITAGHGKAIVTATGMNTRVGQIAHMIHTETSPPTPLQKSLEKTGKILGISALAICAVIFLLGILQQTPPLEMFMIAISLAVAAIPEGLPAVVTIVLALGVRKMALHRAIIRHLPAVETLGSASVICSDKTGTLTQNRMTVTALTSASSAVSTHSSAGKFLLTLGALCCNSVLTPGTSGCSVKGDPTENAILTAAVSNHKEYEHIRQQFPRTGEYPFDASRKRMSTVHSLHTGGYRIIAKGAPDLLLNCCTKVQTESGMTALTSHHRQHILTLNQSLARKAMRVIAVAYKDRHDQPVSLSDSESDLVFVGLIGMTDPPRPQAKAAVAACLKAGIRPVMITGDHILTAKAVAQELGICRNNTLTITGAELDQLSPSQLEAEIHSYSVFARVTPEHKVRIVKAFQTRGNVVAMTGDGVNDAPALRCADIGCAMGISGTDAAKSAADMVLTDDNFATIVEAVEQGRGIFSNIRRTIHFLLSSNIGEILTVLSAFLMKLPSPLLAMQLLWVNLVTDSLPALALGVEPTPEDIMEQPPGQTKKGLFGGRSAGILLEGCLIGALALLAFTIGRIFFDHGGEPVTGRTMTFAVLSLSQLIHAFNLRSDHSLLKIGLFSNPKMILAFITGAILQISVITVPFLSAIFRTTPLTPFQWLIVGVLSLMPLFVAETEKLLHRSGAKESHLQTPHKLSGTSSPNP